MLSQVRFGVTGRDGWTSWQTATFLFFKENFFTRVPGVAEMNKNFNRKREKKKKIYYFFFLNTFGKL
jgi:hypothetical protein